MSQINCNCGEVIPINKDAVFCQKCGNQNFYCKECGAPLSIPKGAVAISCPYCGFTLVQKDMTQEVFFFPVSYIQQTAAERLSWFLLNRFGIPPDICQCYQPQSVNLGFVPVFIYYIKASVTPQIYEVDTRGILGVRSSWFAQHLKDYKFSVKGKIFFKADAVQGSVMKPELTPDQVNAESNALAHKMAQEDVKRFNISAPRYVNDIRYLGMVYYPFFEIYYNYKGKMFKGLVDATNGTVCYSEYPMCSSTQTIVRMVGLIYLMISVLVGLLLAFVLLSPPGGIIAAIQGLIIGLMLIFSTGSKQKGKEEISTTTKKLIIDSLNMYLPPPPR